MHLEQIIARADIINGELDRIAVKLDLINVKIAQITVKVGQINVIFNEVSITPTILPTIDVRYPKSNLEYNQWGEKPSNAPHTGRNK
jgi:hypothetical protein